MIYIPLSIFLILNAIISMIQFHLHRKTWRNLVDMSWQDNQYHQHCPFLAKHTDQTNASHYYLCMLGYEVIVIVLSIIVACDLPNSNADWEFLLGVGLMASKITLIFPLSYQITTNWWQHKHQNLDEE